MGQMSDVDQEWAGKTSRLKGVGIQNVVADPYPSSWEGVEIWGESGSRIDRYIDEKGEVRCTP